MDRHVHIRVRKSWVRIALIALLTAVFVAPVM